MDSDMVIILLKHFQLLAEYCYLVAMRTEDKHTSRDLQSYIRRLHDMASELENLLSR